MARPTTQTVRDLSGTREPVRLASTANIDLDTGGLLTIDGVVTVAGDRVLVKDQTDTTENGIYTASEGAWYRAPDAVTSRALTKAVVVRVQAGTANEGNSYQSTVENPDIGDDAILFTLVMHDGDVAAASEISNDSSVSGSSVADALDTLDTAIAAIGGNISVRAATTANITIATALNNGDTLDGVTLSTGDRVLVKNQSTPAQNGIYIVGATPERSPDFDAFDKHTGIILSVQEGSVNADTAWMGTANAGGTLDTTDITFASLWDRTKVAASDTVAGIVEYAVQSEMEAASSNVLAVTPGRQHFHPGMAKFWAHVTVSGGTPTIATSHNVTSITDSGTGLLTVTIATDFSSSNWCEQANLYLSSAASVLAPMRGAKAAGTILVRSFQTGDGALTDPDAWSVSGFGDHS